MGARYVQDGNFHLLTFDFVAGILEYWSVS